VHVGVLFPVVEFVGYDAFAVPISKEVDRTGGYDADECRSKTFKQGAERFFTVDIAVRSASGQSGCVVLETL